MEIQYHKNFIKAFKKCDKRIQKKFFERRNLFLLNEFHPLLSNHGLSGDFKGSRSINITGDFRVIYVKTDVGILFLDIGTHSQLYG